MLLCIESYTVIKRSDKISVLWYYLEFSNTCWVTTFSSKFSVSQNPRYSEFFILLRFNFLVKNALTSRRPIGKVTPTCPICCARQFRWRRCLRVSKMPPMFRRSKMFVLPAYRSLKASQSNFGLSENQIFIHFWHFQKLKFANIWVSKALGNALYNILFQNLCW